LWLGECGRPLVWPLKQRADWKWQRKSFLKSWGVPDDRAKENPVAHSPIASLVHAAYLSSSRQIN
jgi:hypothetical protein